MPFPLGYISTFGDTYILSTYINTSLLIPLINNPNHYSSKYTTIPEIYTLTSVSWHLWFRSPVLIYILLVYTSLSIYWYHTSRFFIYHPLTRPLNISKQHWQWPSTEIIICNVDDVYILNTYINTSLSIPCFNNPDKYWSK